MITLKRLNVVRKVATEEQAAKLERLGLPGRAGPLRPLWALASRRLTSPKWAKPCSSV